jgi:hypothetical protein
VESILVPEVAAALKDWKANSPNTGVLIGGLALSFYVKPRTTQDVDVLYLSADRIPASVSGFKRTRDSAFQHNRTHVEVEVITPELIKTNPALIAKVIETAKMQDGVAVASPAGLVAMKLGRLSLMDKADIGQLIEYGVRDVSGFPLDDTQLQAFAELVKIVDGGK